MSKVLTSVIFISYQTSWKNFKDWNPVMVFSLRISILTVPFPSFEHFFLHLFN